MVKARVVEGRRRAGLWEIGVETGKNAWVRLSVSFALF